MQKEMMHLILMVELECVGRVGVQPYAFSTTSSERKKRTRIELATEVYSDFMSTTWSALAEEGSATFTSNIRFHCGFPNCYPAHPPPPPQETTPPTEGPSCIPEASLDSSLMLGDTGAFFRSHIIYNWKGTSYTRSLGCIEN